MRQKPNNILAISASLSPMAGLWSDGKFYDGHAGLTLFEQISRLCSENNVKIKDIGALLIDIGPGSFTGVRIAISCAKAFGYLGMEVWSIPSLNIGAYLSNMQGGFSVALDAKRNNVYLRSYVSGEGIVSDDGDIALKSRDDLNDNPNICEIKDYTTKDILDCFLNNKSLFSHADVMKLSPLYIYPLDCSVRKG